jgi:hypothetical protein
MPGSLSVYRLLGQPMARLSLPVLPIMHSVSGLLHHKRSNSLARLWESAFCSISILPFNNAKALPHILNFASSLISNYNLLMALGFAKVSDPFGVIPAIQSTEIDFHVVKRHVELQFSDMRCPGAPAISPVHHNVRMLHVLTKS